MARKDWWSCDGKGATDERKAADDSFAHMGATETVATPSANQSITRRAVLATAGIGALFLGSRRSALSQVAISPDSGQSERNVLVVIFLRGGLDGISAVVPYREDRYYQLRPTLGLAAPSDRSKPGIDRTLDLDGFFGLNPALEPLLPLFREGRLGIIHAIGSEDRTRSHFEAMNAMERGLDTAKGSAASGWLARYLSTNEPASPSPLRAVAFGNIMPDSLRGATHAVALESLAEFRLQHPPGVHGSSMEAAIGELYSQGKDAVRDAGRETLRVMHALRRLDPARYAPANGAVYPETDLGEGLKQVAALMRGRLGLEVAALDTGGWDTHFGQGRSEGLLPSLLGDLARALAAFDRDLGADRSGVTVAVMTEFGRRCYENSTLGTDHGRASVMFLMGGGVRGGKVYGEWPGMGANSLEEPGDLRVTTDYRSALGEVLAKRMGCRELGSVFPGYAAKRAWIVG